MQRGYWATTFRALATAIVWLILTRLLLDYGALVLPLAIRSHLDLETYLSLAQIVSTLLGLGLVFALVPDPRGELGLSPPRGRALARAVLLAPAIFVGALSLGFIIALPTLIEDLRRGGAGASRQNLGEFGRELREAPFLVTFAWGVLLAPVAEELLFRGAVWSALRRLTAPLAPPPLIAKRDDDLDALPLDGPAFGDAARRLRARLADGGLATLGSAAVFGAMHLGVPGGAGIIRVVAATCLGLALGVVRQASGTLAVPLALHVTYNLLAVGHTRGWFTTEALPNRFGVPTMIAIAAVVGLPLAFVVGRARPSAPPAAG